MSLAWRPIQHTHLTDRVYEQVRDRILSRAIEVDRQVNVDEIAAQLEVSRTPVIDAIKRLAAEGLVEIKARRGTFVKGITEHDLLEIFQIREAFELFAARQTIASPRHSEIVMEMARLLDVMGEAITATEFKDYTGFTIADRAFHTVMIDACDNRRMQSSYENLNVHMHIMRGHFFRNLEPPQRVHADHTAIFKAIRDRDLGLAKGVIMDHLNAIRVRMLDNIRANGGTL